MAELKKCWIVATPSKQSLAEVPDQTADDLIYETTADGLVSVIIGTEAVPGRWRMEKTKIHTDRASAVADAEKRLAAIRKRMKKGYDFRQAGA